MIAVAPLTILLIVVVSVSLVLLLFIALMAKPVRRGILRPDVGVVLSKAAHEAGGITAGRVSTKHLLWAILDRPAASIQVAMAAHGVDAEELRDELQLPPPADRTPRSGQVRWDPLAGDALQSAGIFPGEGEDGPDGPEDLLIALVECPDEMGELLRSRGFSKKSIRAALAG